MTRKFLFCFPLRVGNVIFGYIVIALSIAVVAFNLYKLGLGLVSERSELDEKFRNFEKVDSIFGQQKEDLVSLVMILYYACYIVIGMLMFVFAAMFTFGAYRANRCLVTTFFVYCFVHLFLSVCLVVWEALTKGWIQLGLILGFDVILIVCLFSVKYLIEAIRSGHMYSRPGEVYHKY